MLPWHAGAIVAAGVGGATVGWRVGNDVGGNVAGVGRAVITTQLMPMCRFGSVRLLAISNQLRCDVLMKTALSSSSAMNGPALNDLLMTHDCLLSAK
jgi:hypothetical protein